MYDNEFTRRIAAFGDQKSKYRDYWLNRLAGILVRSNFPYDHKKKQNEMPEANMGFKLSGQLFPGLMKLAKDSSYKLHVVMAAALTLLLNKYTGNNDIIIGTPIYKQKNPGDFINTLLPLRNRFDETMTFKELLLQVRETIAAAVEHQNFPVELLSDRLKLPAGGSEAAEDFLLFDVLILLENIHDRSYSRHIKPSMTFVFAKEETCIEGRLEYNSTLYEKRTVEQITRHYIRLLEIILGNTNIPIIEVDILSAEEKEQLLFVFNDTRTVYPSGQSVYDLFRDQAGETPHRTAVVYEDEFLTYEGLQARAAQITGYLHKEGDTRQEDRIGIMMDKSTDIIAVITGILAAGCVYVPIDVTMPAERIKWMIDDTGLEIIIGHKRYIKLLNRLQWECRWFNTFLCIDSGDVCAEEEIEKSELMGKNLWEYVGESSTDDITAGGWISSYTGEPISKQEMDEYGDSALAKLAPILHERMRVLEIGCSSGLTMYRAAPQVALYYGVDLSSVIIEKNKERIRREGIKNIRLACMPAHDIQRLEEKNFDLIIINSVIQCFHGHNYLRKVLRKALDLLNPKGWLFIGDVMDQGLKEALINEMTAFKRENRDKNYKTKTDWSSELFVSREFFEDLVWEFAGTAKVEFSSKIYTIENELTRFRYDALITIDKSGGWGAGPRAQHKKHKYQHDRRSLEHSGNGSPHQHTKPGNLAYIMYTSGSTGRSKGVLVAHQNVVRLVKNTNYITFNEGDRILQTGAVEFDASTFEIWGALLNGLTLYLAGKDNIVIAGNIKEIIGKYGITLMWMTSPLFNRMSEADTGIFAGVKSLIVGGDTLSPEHISRVSKRFPGMNIINGYGPTENTTFSSTYSIKVEYTGSIPIGSPIANSLTYILNVNLRLVPLGVPGELCVGGDGLSRGYLNNPELTFEKFCPWPGRHLHTGTKNHGPGIRIYRTGDLTRWLPGGIIEFLGRKDNQVKIRGFRVELDEIENQLSHMEGIHEAVVTAKEDPGGDRLLCAYVVCEKDIDIKEIKEYLELRLPAYMIPAYFTRLDRMSLTPNGKIDRKALAGMEIKIKQGEPSSAPGDYHEETLARIWSEVLKIDQSAIGIDDNFFELGGHSLRATVVISNIHKELNVKVPLAEIFRIPTIRELVRYIKGTVEDKFISILPVEKKEYYPLSSAQKRLYILQQLMGTHTGYNETAVVELKGRVEKGKLEKTFTKLLARHESLRTSFETVKGELVQGTAREVEFRVDYREVEEDQAEKIMKTFVKPFHLGKPPLMRIALFKTGEEIYLLVYDMHHIITDGTSQAVLIREFTSLYNGKSLAPLRIQYKDFSEWQRSLKVKKILKKQELYWISQFQGEIPVLSLPTDYPRPGLQDFAGDRLSFTLTIDESRSIKKFALKEGVTLYMLLLAIYNVMLSRLSRQEDIVVGAVIAARRHADWQRIIGMFVNTMALRNYPEGNKRFTDFLKEVKSRTMQAFENQEYPFEDLVEKVAINRDTGRNPLFDTLIAVQNMEVQEEETGIPAFEIPGLEITPRRFPNSTSKFDLSLHVIENGEALVFILEYCTSLFKKETMERFLGFFMKISAGVIEAPDKKIKDFEIISNEEKERILVDFNGTAVEYPRNKTIHQLFEEQVERTPGHIAAAGQGVKSKKHGGSRHTLSIVNCALTYRELSNRSGQLASYLMEKGTAPDGIVGIMVERSLEMIIGILGILKSGGAYLPIDPEYPGERAAYMLEDSKVKILVKNSNNFSISGRIKKETESFKEIEIVDFQRGAGGIPVSSVAKQNHLDSLPVPVTAVPSSSTLTSTLTCRVSPANLAYIIYTSGSTGKPKGVPVGHGNVVRLVKETNFIQWEAVTGMLLTGSISFDISTFEIWGPLVNGVTLYLEKQEVILDGKLLEGVLQKNKIDVMHLVPQLFNQLADQYPDIFAGLRYFLVGGDLVQPHHVNKIRNQYKDIKILHMYGPTENTVFSTFHPVDKDYENTIPIGKPVANSEVYIVDKYNKLVPIGIAGELLVGGDGLARGYLNNPGLTAEKFDRDLWDYQDYHDEAAPFGQDLNAFGGSRAHELHELTRIRATSNKKGAGKKIDNRSHRSHMSYKPYPSHIDKKVPGENPPSPHHPITPLPHYPIYRTGDLARWLPDGNIEFMGRIDSQIKVRGIRVEPGEIESLLLKHAEIKEVVVIDRQNQQNEKYLCAYFTAAREIPGPGIREYLATKLPEAMIPAFFIQLEQLPLTSSFKVHRKLLPPPGEHLHLQAEATYVAPQDNLEKTIANIWKDVLSLDKIGIYDNFFDLGGNSLSIIKVNNLLKNELQEEILIADMFRYPTVESLAKYIKQGAKDILMDKEIKEAAAIMEESMQLLLGDEHE